MARFSSYVRMVLVPVIWITRLTECAKRGMT